MRSYSILASLLPNVLLEQIYIAAFESNRKAALKRHVRYSSPCRPMTLSLMGNNLPVFPISITAGMTDCISSVSTASTKTRRCCNSRVLFSPCRHSALVALSYFTVSISSKCPLYLRHLGPKTNSARIRTSHADGETLAVARWAHRYIPGAPHHHLAYLPFAGTHHGCLLRHPVNSSRVLLQSLLPGHIVPRRFSRGMA